MVLPGVPGEALLAEGAIPAHAPRAGGDELGGLSLEGSGVGEREVGDAKTVGDAPVEPRDVLARPEKGVDPVLQRPFLEAIPQLVDDEVRHGHAVGVGTVGAGEPAASPSRP